MQVHIITVLEDVIQPELRGGVVAGTVEVQADCQLISYNEGDCNRIPNKFKFCHFRHSLHELIYLILQDVCKCIVDNKAPDIPTDYLVVSVHPIVYPAKADEACNSQVDSPDLGFVSVEGWVLPDKLFRECRV